MYWLAGGGTDCQTFPMAEINATCHRLFYREGDGGRRRSAGPLPAGASACVRSISGVTLLIEGDESGALSSTRLHLPVETSEGVGDTCQRWTAPDVSGTDVVLGYGNLRRTISGTMPPLIQTVLTLPAQDGSVSRSTSACLLALFGTGQLHLHGARRKIPLGLAAQNGGIGINTTTYLKRGGVRATKVRRQRAHLERCRPAKFCCPFFRLGRSRPVHPGKCKGIAADVTGTRTCLEALLLAGGSPQVVWSMAPAHLP